MADSNLRDPVDEKLQALEKSLAAIARLEAELQKKEATTQALINASGDRAMLLDSEGVILAANETAAAAMSGSVKDLIGKNAFLVFPPEIAKTRKAHHDAVVRTKRPLKYEDVRNNRRLETRLNPILDTDGSVTHVAVFSRDVTELKAASEALDAHRQNLEKEVKERTAELEAANARLKAEIEEKRRADRYRSLFGAAERDREVYRSLLHSSADAIVIYDMEGNARYVSPSFTRIFGWTQEELEGKRIGFVPESEKEKTI
ncbi:MAG: PAS domain S-box protein, partial [Deltaproteobacteria bacterium]|nr:PAS domain S-box protein [Deltaproteobacteria bacterium]